MLGNFASLFLRCLRWVTFAFCWQPEFAKSLKPNQDPRSGSEPVVTLVVFLRGFLETTNFEKIMSADGNKSKAWKITQHAKWYLRVQEDEIPWAPCMRFTYQTKTGNAVILPFVYNWILPSCFIQWTWDWVHCVSSGYRLENSKLRICTTVPEKCF